MKITKGVAAILAVATAGINASAQTPNWKDVDTSMGRAGTLQPDSTYRFAFPRSDMNVIVDGVKLKPALALGGWVAMKAVTGGVVAMGDLVLAEDEVTAVLTKLQQGGIEQTAVHHHVLRESPRVLYMHVHAHGDAVKIAKAIHDAIVLTKILPPPPPTAAQGDLGIDADAVGKALGYAGKVNGGVLQFGIPRAESIRDAGMPIPASMGLSTAINFQPTGSGKAAITGDFVMTAAEVNPVIRALRESGIEVTALHSHMLNEEPRLFFMHFWANDDAVKLAKGLRSALERTNSVKPKP